MKELLSGNEAIARGAYEAGVKVGVGYPGTPSTEVLENLRKFNEVYAESVSYTHLDVYKRQENICKIIFNG